MGSGDNKPKAPSSIALLSGGVGGARLATGLTRVSDDLTVIVNVGDDETMYGLHVSPDVDTVVYTLAGRQGPRGWGLANDTYAVMTALSELGVDTTFRLGDADLANCLARTQALSSGSSLSAFTASMAKRFNVSARVVPATDDPVHTRLRTTAGEWLGFQEYFVGRAHRDRIDHIEFDGAATAQPAPGVLEAIEHSDLVVIGPSNPPLSIWPILAIDGIRDAVAAASAIAISPLIGGKTVKGPAADVLESLGLGTGSAAVAAAYEGLIAELIVDDADGRDVVDGVTVRATNTLIPTPADAERLARWL